MPSNAEIGKAFAEMVKTNGIDREVLESILKESFTRVMQKRYGETSNFDVIVNMDRGVIEIYLYKTVVEEVQDPLLEIDKKTAEAKSGEEFEIGDEFVEEISIDSFGRRYVLNLRQHLMQKVREIEKEITYKKFKELEGNIIAGEVYQIKPNSILLIHDKTEITFPKSEQIPKERYKKGDTIKILVKSVERRPSGPLIIGSRADDLFLYKLFQGEIPEIEDNEIEIKAIARIPGERAKVAVVSNNIKIDAVGACVGQGGKRIHAIVRELSNENIDIVGYSDDPIIYISRALSPAKIYNIEIDKENRYAKVYADAEQMSLLIGKDGQNIKLASKLTGYQIDVARDNLKTEEITKNEEE